MRYLYSVIRFVPDVARGEFINVGAIVGGDSAGAWGIRQIENPARARTLDERDCLRAAWDFINEVGRLIDAHNAASEFLTKPPVELDEEWLHQVHYDQQGIVQLSEPCAISASGVDVALDDIFSMMILDPAKPERDVRTRIQVVARLRQEFLRQQLQRDIHFRERVDVESDPHRQAFDFVVANGRALQLSQTWSFQVSQQERVSEQVKAWGYTVERVREQGGRIRLEDGTEFKVESNVEVELVYVPPKDDGPTGVCEEARAIADRNKVAFVPEDKSAAVAERAARLLDSKSTD